MKKVFIRSGIRFDYLMADKDRYIFARNCVEYHVSGQLKVAPEHVSDTVLTLMGKPENSVYQEFVKEYKKMNKKTRKRAVSCAVSDVFPSGIYAERSG